MLVQLMYQHFYSNQQMKNIKFLLFIAITNISYSQSTLVEYSEKIERNSFSILHHKYRLYIKQNETLYDQLFESKPNTEEMKADEEGITTIRRIYATSERMKFVYKKNDEITFKDLIANRDVVVIEEPINFKWKLINETKKIGSYNCKKASTFFRGRNYTAWYAEDIALSSGPSKFFGLPGLILEIFDAEKIIHIHVTKVILKSNKFDFSKRIDWIKNSKKIDIKEYFKQKKYESQEEINHLNSKLGKNEPRYKLEDSPQPKNIEIY